MNLQDRAYAAAIFIVIGICCIGAYVAISGFFNANPGGISITFNTATATTIVETNVQVLTETTAPPSLTPSPTVPPTPTPKGFIPSVTPALTRPPTLDFLPTVPTGEPATDTPLAPRPTATPSGCGAPFCPRAGPPDNSGLAPGGEPCPQNYLWGFVRDENGRGIPGVRVRGIYSDGGVNETSTTKGPPDPAIGRYDFVSGGGTWTLQLIDLGGSSVFRIQAHQAYTGGSNCPTRVDFVKQ